MVKRQLIALAVAAAFPLIGVVVVTIATAVQAAARAATGHHRA